MKIRIDDKLIDYMKAHGHKDIVLYVKVGGGCCGTFPYVKARFAKKSDGNLADAGYESMDTELGKLYYLPGKVIIDEHVELLLDKMLGMTSVQVIGIQAADERLTRCNLK